jgi:hypothetical protein
MRRKKKPQKSSLCHFSHKIVLRGEGSKSAPFSSLFPLLLPAPTLLPFLFLYVLVSKIMMSFEHMRNT